MPLIRLIHAREILDSRGNPTVEVEVFTENGSYGRASVPSGASTGSHEALELRDGNKNRYLGKGVLRAVNNVNNIIAKELLSMDVRNQEEIDNKMLLLDGTENKSNLGANAILGVSLAVAHCAANYNKVNLYEYLSKAGEISLPRPMMNILNGGAHANFCIDFQEIMIIPQGMKTFKERLRCGAEVFHSLKVILKENGYYLGVGDEGGYAANLKDNEEAFILVCKAIERANYVVGKDVCLAIDAASSEFYNKESKKYFLSKENKHMNYKELVDEFYMPLIEKYPIISIEDPLAEDDVEGWQYISEKLSDRIQLVGDDLFVTNKKRLKWGIDLNIANSILIKVNQIGTLTETLQTIELAKKHNYKVIISHRSGETEDTTIADLSVATNAGQIKTGSLSRTDRIAKYNQLLRIEEEIEKRTER